MNTQAGKTVYEISVDDLQEVAKEVLRRELTDDEIVVVGNSVGDYIDWFQAIENAINSQIR
jgi:UDP-N-acetylglucosamine 2-epimerase